MSAGQTHSGEESRLITVTTAEGLEKLPRSFLIPSTVRVHLDLPDIDERELRRSESRLSRQLSACGCGEGAALGLLYLFVVPALVLTGTIAVSSPLRWVAVFAGFFAVLVGGKVAGLMIARARLHQEIARVRRLLAAAVAAR